jgi:predicted ATPase/class 3 adenylate cyclase/predicted negative regulator of RcsB-dependent stress response
VSDVRALLLTDVVDSTRLSAALGDAAAAALWAAHDRVARDLLRAWRGREIDRTDGFLLLFDRAADAAGFAAAYHRALAGLEVPLHARAALHVGPVVLRENSAADVALGAKPLEVEGLAKPVVARILSLAEGGRTLLSGAATAALGGSLPEGQVLHRQGHYRVKGIDEPVEIAELAAPQAACVPPPDVEKAYRVVKVGDLWSPARRIRHNLPAERDAFIGREAELGRLAGRLDAGARLLTVLGPGGTGKTRLVRRYAHAWLGEWPGGVYFCDLSAARSLDGIHVAVALALGVPLGRGDAGTQLGHAIAARGRCLVILDNFEQVQPHAEATVGRWLDRAAEARFVVTSRERLHVAGEEIAALEPMDVASDALRLFEARASAQQPGFAIDAGNRAAVIEIVRLLDGLPLAVELAAARVRVLSPAQIVVRMQDRFRLLAGARGVAARQATLKAAIDWSWDLLAPWEQAALAQCSVFEGGFTLEAAEAVIALGAWPEAPPVLDVVNALVDKSLLRTWLPASTGRLDIAEPFFGMYLSIHEYASQKLQASGAHADALARHGRYFAGFGSDVAMDGLLTHGGLTRRQTLALELDNLVGACRRAIARREPECAAGTFLAAWAVLEAQGPFGVAADLGRQVVALEGLAPHARAQAMLATAAALRASGEIADADALLERAAASVREAGDRPLEAMALRELAVASHRHGRTDVALRQFEDSRALYESLGPRSRLGALVANLANLQMEMGRMDEARASYRAALGLHREVGNRAAEGIALGNLGTLLYELGDIDEARAAYDEALRIHREAGSVVQEAITLYNLGILHSRQGELRHAADCYAAALRIYRETGNRRGEGVALGQIGELHQMLGEHDDARARFDEALRIHREVGNRRFEGGVLTSLGDLLLSEGKLGPSLEALDAGERLLRDVGDPLSVAKLLCVKGRARIAGGDAGAARALLAEAESIGARVGANAASELGTLIAGLRDALA